MQYGGYNDYSAPPGIELLYDDKMRPVSAIGCLDDSQFKQPNHTFYAFCALVETYRREPANNTNLQVTSLTNVTRYSGVIVVQSNVTVKTAYGLGNPITCMAGEVQISTNAGALVYPPLGLPSSIARLWTASFPPPATSSTPPCPYRSTRTAY